MMGPSNADVLSAEGPPELVDHGALCVVVVEIDGDEGVGRNFQQCIGCVKKQSTYTCIQWEGRVAEAKKLGGTHMRQQMRDSRLQRLFCSSSRCHLILQKGVGGEG